MKKVAMRLSNAPFLSSRRPLTLSNCGAYSLFVRVQIEQNQGVHLQAKNN